MYTIATDAVRNLVRVDLSGLLTVDEVATHIAELRGVMLQDRIRADYGIIIDLSACSVQTQDMVAAMAKHMATLPKAGSIAVVCTTVLARMQARRLFKQDHARVVTTSEEALAWVCDRQEPSHNRSTQPATPSM